MVFFNPPRLAKNGVVTLGESRYQATFDDYTLNITSSELFDGPTTRVCTEPEYRKAAREYEMSLDGITRTSRIRTSDGVPIIYFIKDGMTFPWPDNKGSDLAAQSLAAIQTLVIDYPPPRKLEDNARYNANLEEEIEKSKSMGQAFGVYHWALWRPTGKRQPRVSSQAQPSSAQKRAALQVYWTNTRWETVVMSGWFSCLEPEAFRQYQTCYHQLSANGSLGVLDESEHGCQSGRALLVNAVSNPHKDPGDVKRGWTWTYPWGDTFKGGECGYPALGLKFEQGAGDILASPAGALEHMICPHTGGDRYSNVRFTKANIMNPPEYRFFCDVPGCNLGFATRGGLRNHKQIKNDAIHQTAREEAQATPSKACASDISPSKDNVDEDDSDDSSEYFFNVESVHPPETQTSGHANVPRSASSPSPAQPIDTSSQITGLPQIPAHVDRRPRFYCEIPTCKKSRIAGFQGWAAKNTQRRHRKKEHPQ